MMRFERFSDGVCGRAKDPGGGVTTFVERAPPPTPATVVEVYATSISASRRRGVPGSADERARACQGLVVLAFTLSRSAWTPCSASRRRSPRPAPLLRLRSILALVGPGLSTSLLRATRHARSLPLSARSSFSACFIPPADEAARGRGTLVLSSGPPPGGDSQRPTAAATSAASVGPMSGRQAASSAPDPPPRAPSFAEQAARARSSACWPSRQCSPRARRAAP